MNEPEHEPSAQAVDESQATATGDDELLAALADDFAARLRRGEHPTVEEYAAKHPALAERVRNVLSAAAMMEQTRAWDAPAGGEGPGTIIGRYKLLERIGEGGFGVVYMAEQQQPVRRKVALKVIKPGMDSRQVLARFDVERQALALMDHPNIAKIFDGGMTDSGRPYFVMELVKGEPITAFCDANQLPPRQRLDLFVQVCNAVQHAHQKGIIHRDIKPSNVLVSMHDTKPVVKVIDFGVAKALGHELTEQTLFTGFAQLLGTPLYMSPEQAGQSAIDVDTRSDIYSLGVLLYELLTGTTPFDKERFRQAAQDEILRIIREEEPPRPSTRLSESKQTLASISVQRHTEPSKLTKLVRGELDWIVMKALEKDRTRRYETANGLARDVERYLHDEQVLACPPSASYRLRKFVRRNRTALATGAVVIMVLVAGTVVSTWQAIRATRAIHAEREMRQHLDRALTAAKESESAAKESERVAVANANKAYVERIRAKDYFLSGRLVVDRMAERLKDPRLLQIPEIAAIRKQLLQDLLDSYQKIVQVEAGDASGAQERASALRMVGDIRRMLGERALAETAYRESIALREQYVAQRPHDLDYYQVLATSHAHLGDLMAEMNRPAEVEAAYRRALECWAPLATDRPHVNIAYVESLRKYHKALFNLLHDGGKNEVARTICGQLLLPFEEMSARSPNDMELQIRLADALHWGGHLLADTGRADEARKLNDRSLDLYSKLPTTAHAVPAQRAQMAQRYINKARLLSERNRKMEAASAYGKAIELYPGFAAAPFNLGAGLASRNKLKGAADLYARWLEVYPDEHSNWCRAAAIYLSIGDVEHYRSACREMLDRFEQPAAERPEIAERMTKACALAPGSVPDFSRVERLAQRSFAGAENDGFGRSFVLARGLVEYRTGHYEQAVDWLNRFAPKVEGTHGDATAFAGLAMASHKLGHVDRARASLGSGRAILARKPRSIARDGPWLEWLHCEILCREAEQILAK